MRWLIIPLLACAMCAPVVADDDDYRVIAPAGTQTSSDVTVDPVTGVKTTTTTTVRRWTDAYTTYGAPRVYGAPVYVNPWPANPFDGQIISVDGRNWRWDADDAKWEEED